MSATGTSKHVGDESYAISIFFSYVSLLVLLGDLEYHFNARIWNMDSFMFTWQISAAPSCSYLQPSLLLFVAYTGLFCLLNLT